MKKRERVTMIFSSGIHQILKRRCNALKRNDIPVHDAPPPWIVFSVSELCLHLLPGAAPLKYP